MKTFTVLAIFLTFIFITGNEAHKLPATSGSEAGNGGHKLPSKSGSEARPTTSRPSNPRTTQAATTPQMTSPSPPEHESGEESSHGHKGIFHGIKSLFGGKVDALQSKGDHLFGGVTSGINHVISKVDALFGHVKSKGT